MSRDRQKVDLQFQHEFLHWPLTSQSSPRAPEGSMPSGRDIPTQRLISRPADISVVSVPMKGAYRPLCGRRKQGGDRLRLLIRDLPLLGDYYGLSPRWNA